MLLAIHLPCGHELLFQRTAIPRLEDHLWCSRCGKYVRRALPRECYELTCDDCGHAYTYRTLRGAQMALIRHREMTKHTQIDVTLSS